MSRQYRECPACGAHLDPGEVCDCRERTESEPRENKERAAPGAGTPKDGKAEQNTTPVSASRIADSEEKSR